jgi:hypothetical protein
MEPLKIAHIVPISCMIESEHINDMHLLLYHWAKQYPEYLKFYSESKKYKILDNSFYELQKEIDYDDLLKVAKQIRADEIVAPDIMFEFQKTKKLIEDFLPLVPKGLKVQAVVCGKRKQELQKCFEYLNNNERIDVIAISKHGQIKFHGEPIVLMRNLDYYRTRKMFFEYAQVFAEKPIHFLGMNDYREFFTPTIRSIDTKWLAKEVTGEKIDIDTDFRTVDKWFLMKGNQFIRESIKNARL